MFLYYYKASKIETGNLLLIGFMILQTTDYDLLTYLLTYLLTPLFTHFMKESPS